jgi:hypothetical protein
LPNVADLADNNKLSISSEKSGEEYQNNFYTIRKNGIR